MSALVFPGAEEFGITAVEAQAAGSPVIAYGVGGVTESVRGGDDAATGVFFEPQTAEALVDAVFRLEQRSFDPKRLRANAERFDTHIFQQGFRRAVDEMLAGHGNCRIGP